MIREFKKITLIKIKRSNKNINEELQLFSRALGMFGERDKEKSCYRVFIEIVKAKKPIKSEYIAKKANLSRATVVHHLHNLIESGIIKNEKNGYILRVERLKELINLIKEDIDDVFCELEEMAKDIDKELEL